MGVGPPVAPPPRRSWGGVESGQLEQPALPWIPAGSAAAGNAPQLPGVRDGSLRVSTVCGDAALSRTGSQDVGLRSVTSPQQLCCGTVLVSRFVYT